MIAVSGFELSVGPRTLMSDVSFRIDAGDKIGLVGRNGAGKTTMTKVLAGISDDRDGHAFSGKIERSGEIGYLPQDPRSGDPKQTARRRILDARGLGELVEGMRLATEQMGEGGSVADEAMRRYSRLEDRFLALGGYAAEAEGAAIASNLQLPDRILDQPLETLSGGQRRRIELARILFSGADTMLLDEPTNHLDADSVVWLREFLKGYQGGLMVISHDML
jgi:ATPase subunit of ABC transporter with duplicated ATPase domains